MSLIISVYTREGLVMAADSRLTLQFPRQGLPGQQPVTISSPTSDSATKLFLLGNGIGVAAYGMATIGGSPFAGAIETFSIEHDLAAQMLTPEQTAIALKDFLAQVAPGQATFFHVGGYLRSDSSIELQLWVVDPVAGSVIKVNPPGQQGAQWGGEHDVLQRLIGEVFLPSTQGPPQLAPQFPVPFEFFTLQDAIDFALFGVRTTANTMRFQNREKTVGGPVDLLVLSPGGAHWVAKKQLHAERSDA